MAVLRIQLQCFGKEMTFGQLGMESLRFFLKGQSQHVFGLYELILNNTLGVALASSPTDREPVVLDRRCVRPVGFEPDEGMLPYSTRSFLGYRLLTEYFAFPQKFLFFDLGRAGRAGAGKGGQPTGNLSLPQPQQHRPGAKRHRPTRCNSAARRLSTCISSGRNPSP